MCGVVGDIGVALYPGQSAEDVLKIAAVIECELDDITHYGARNLARKILLAMGCGLHTAGGARD